MNAGRAINIYIDAYMRGISHPSNVSLAGFARSKVKRDTFVWQKLATENGCGGFGAGQGRAGQGKGVLRRKYSKEKMSLSQLRKNCCASLKILFTWRTFLMTEVRYGN